MYENHLLSKFYVFTSFATVDMLKHYIISWRELGRKE